MLREAFRPFKLWPNWLDLVDRETRKADFRAGLTNAFLSLPQAVAFAMIAGLPPEFGLFSAIVSPVVAGLFGSSLHVISGPTTTAAITVFATVSPLAEPGSLDFQQKALLLTLMAGLVQLGFALGRLGVLVNFVSPTVILGFTTGTSVLILISQLKNVLGLPIPASAGLFEAFFALFRHSHEVNVAVVFTALMTVFSSMYFKKFLRGWPNMMLALIVGSFYAWLLGGDAVGISRLGELPSALPAFRFFTVDLEKMRPLATGAVAVALLGLLQTLSVSKSLAEKTGQRLDLNRQFFGDGLSNIIGAMFSGFVSSASFTRSGVNLDAGARTPMSAIFASGILLLLLLLARPAVGFMAIPAIGGVVLMVAWNLIDLEQMKKIWRTSRLESTVLGVTTLGALFFNLEFAILLGALTSLAYFLYRIAHPQIATMAPDPDRNFRFTFVAQKPSLKECPAVKIIRIDGPIFYGSINSIDDFFEEMRPKSTARNCLIFAEGVHFIDLAGAEWIVREVSQWRERGGDVFFVNVKSAAQAMLETSGAMEKVGRDHFFETKTQAIEWLHRSVDRSFCEVCKGRFGEKRGVQKGAF